MFADAATDDFFCARLDHMIDLRHPLAVLASRMPWQRIEASVAHLFSRKAHTGQSMPDLDLFGEAPAPIARQSNAGRPRVPLRTMIALLYLKHAFDLNDEAVVERWSDSPNFQFFSDQAYFEPRLPCDATTLVKFRRLLGEEGVEELLAQTVNLAVSSKLIPAPALATLVVDSTVQEKAVAHPQTPSCWRQRATSWCRLLRKWALSSNRPLPRKASCCASRLGATRTQNNSSACAGRSSARARWWGGWCARSSARPVC